MPKKPNPPNICIFCQKPGKSKEHLFGEWLKPWFPRTEEDIHTLGSLTWPEETKTPEPVVTTTKGQGHTGSRKIPVVCEDCNNGWMAILEEQAKPILVPLITAYKGVIDFESQRILATWAAKTAMVAEYIQPGKPATISQLERTWLYKERMPPAKWRIFMCAYDGGKWGNLSIFQQTQKLQKSPVPEPGESPDYVQATTFGLGHVIFSVLATSRDNISAVFDQVDLPGIHRIWLNNTVIDWPHNFILSNTDVNMIANVLMNIFPGGDDGDTDEAFTFDITKI